MKKEYQEPEVKKVELVPEEAVLTACKTGDTIAGGYTQGRCSGVVGLACQSSGS